MSSRLFVSRSHKAPLTYSEGCSCSRLAFGVLQSCMRRCQEFTFGKLRVGVRPCDPVHLSADGRLSRHTLWHTTSTSAQDVRLCRGDKSKQTPDTGSVAGTRGDSRTARDCISRIKSPVNLPLLLTAAYQCSCPSCVRLTRTIDGTA